MPLRYVKQPDIYQGDTCVRFALGVRGNRTLVVFGLNPSTASEACPDTTINRVETFAERLGFDGWLMVNLYPQRATKPKELHQRLNEALHRRNMAAIAATLGDLSTFTLCAAWGAKITTRRYLYDCLGDINERCRACRRQWSMFGEGTQDGHPRHPSRLSLDRTLVPFSVREYLDR